MSCENQIVAADLFCGVGGLTHGLTRAGIEVRLGVDIDPACQFPMERNNSAKFLKADVSKLCKSEILHAFGNAKVTLLAGCAPCQPFSSYSQTTRREEKHGDWGLLLAFSSLVLSVRPTFVTMENVPPLRRQEIFAQFVSVLMEAGYYIDHEVVDGRDIGLPQRRQRLVMVASLLGAIKLPKIRKPKVTVRDTISNLPPISAGSSDLNDPLHVSASLSTINLQRIRHSKPGGTWRDWPKDIISPCHTRETGETYPSVYGRMEWDEPAPTMTTQFYGFGNGRFGHPEQDRAISLREAAMLQGFPKDYAFVSPESPIHFSTLGRLIGNAVPVPLGEYIGCVFNEHLKKTSRKYEETTDC